MGGFSMNKVLGNLKKRQTISADSVAETPIDHANDTPDSIAARCVKQFCLSVGSSSGDDVVFLPSIVEATVASPVAAAESARLIRKFLQRDYWSKPSCQYNAIMLVRILADNPGPGFTKFMDKKFIDATKELLRSGRDASVRQILMETLDSFETSKSLDEGLAPMIEMWKKEKEKAYKTYGGMSGGPVQPSMMPPPGFNPYPQHQPQAYYPRPSHSKRLPDPVELTNRLEEARSSAKLLEQVVACTPAAEFLSNDLIKEFADRCSSASRSIQGYMAAENPGPDNDTMENLIDTNEQLQQALNHHRRALLQAKKQLGLGDGRSSTSSPAPHLPSPIDQSGGSMPAVPPRKAVGGAAGGGNGNGKGKAYLNTHDHSSSSAAIAGSSRSASGTPRRHSTDDDDDNQDPFRDPPTESHYTAAAGGSSSRPGAGSALGGGGDSGPPRLSFEPFHPGFGGGPGGSSSADKARAEPVTPVSDDGTDLYKATPKQDGGPVYRY